MPYGAAAARSGSARAGPMPYDVGIRIPMADFCRDLVRRFGRPIVSTSANISGEPTPKRFADIPQTIKDSVDCILDPSLERQSSGKASSIIKVGIDGTIDIIRK